MTLVKDSVLAPPVNFYMGSNRANFGSLAVRALLPEFTIEA
jgi:hypothetical protein